MTCCSRPWESRLGSRFLNVKGVNDLFLFLSVNWFETHKFAPFSPRKPDLLVRAEQIPVFPGPLVLLPYRVQLLAKGFRVTGRVLSRPQGRSVTNLPDVSGRQPVRIPCDLLKMLLRDQPRGESLYQANALGIPWFRENEDAVEPARPIQEVGLQAGGIIGSSDPEYRTIGFEETVQDIEKELGCHGTAFQYPIDVLDDNHGWISGRTKLQDKVVKLAAIDPRATRAVIHKHKPAVLFESTQDMTNGQGLPGARRAHKKHSPTRGNSHLPAEISRTPEGVQILENALLQRRRKDQILLRNALPLLDVRRCAVDTEA